MNYKETIEIAKKQLKNNAGRVAYVGETIGVIIIFDIDMMTTSCHEMGEKAVEVIKDFHVNSCTFNRYIDGRWGFQINIERPEMSDEEFYKKIDAFKELV